MLLMKFGTNKGVTMKNIKLALITLFVLGFSSYLFADIYPAPINLTASKGNADNITINWEAPTPPEFGQGFESAQMPPEDWSIDVQDSEHTWQIMNNTNYVHSGSYAACVPWTYEPDSQDEWLISPEYNVTSGDELIFYLGTSKAFGANSPVYVLASDDDFNSYDTLLICNGENLDNEWEFKEYSVNLDDYSSSIKIAFRYLGGNGDLVCLDDVNIAGSKVNITEFFVVPHNTDKITSIKSRAPVNTKKRSIELTGYQLFKKLYVDSKFKQIPDNSTILTDTMYIDEEVKKDSAYIYQAYSIFNGDIHSTNYSKADTGFIADENNPPKPSDIRTGTNWTPGNGLTFRWTNPYAFDISSYNIYSGDVLLTNVQFDGSVDSYSILFTDDPDPDPTEYEYQLYNEIYELNVSAVDFNGNESSLDPQDIQTIAPAPQIGISTEMFYNNIKVQKWAPSQDCSSDDNIKLYRSTDDKLSTFSLLKDFSDPASSQYFDSGVLEYPDYEASTDSAYFYFATLEYPEYGTSDTSYIWPENTPDFVVDNISNLDYQVYDDHIEFSWDEPSGDSLRYGGVYCYRGNGSGTPADTVYRGTTNYNYQIEFPSISNFTFWPFDKWGTKSVTDKKNIIKHLMFSLEYVHICQDTAKVIEDFSNGLDPVWSQVNKGDESSTWNASDSGSSQWFPVTTDDGPYGWVNDDVAGSGVRTNCYLAMPAITGLTGDDKVYLKFDNFYSNKYDGSAYISLNVDGNWKDVYSIIEMEDYSDETWQTYSVNISSLLRDSEIDSFQIGFHFNDNNTWSSGWAIDNVSVLSTSEPSMPAKLMLNQNNNFFQANAYPNPTKGSLNISFYVKESSPVTLEIYNILGQKIATVCNDSKISAGLNTKTWNGLDAQGMRVSSGIYFYRLNIDNKIKTSKFMMVK